MAKIGLFYGTQTSNTQTAAEMIQKEFGGDFRNAFAFREFREAL